MRLLVPTALLLAACTGKPDPEPKDTAPDEETGTPDTAETAVDEDTCALRGLTRREWDGAASDGAFDTVAPDFSLNLLDGTTFTWSEQSTGCDTVVSIVYRSAPIAYPDFSRFGDIREWLEGSPQNVHYLIWVDEMRGDDREAALATIQATVDEAISRIDDEELQAWWPTRVHYVTDNPTNVEGGAWIEAIHSEYADYNTNWGIDRFGVVRELGYLADPVTGWNEAPPWFLTYEVEWFNHQSDLQDQLDGDGATVLRAFEETDSRLVTLELPDAATMATFDTLELDMSFICSGHPDPVGCGEWDYLAYAYLCDNDDPGTTETDESNTCTEIGRFITAYARPGRWVVDATPFLAMMQGGGTHTFRVNSANAPYITLDLRFSNQGKGYRPVGIEYLWSGGSWDASYNTLHPDITFTPPAGTSRVDVWTLVSGHGYGQDRENCAEFCNHQHEFTVNGGLVVMQEFVEAGTDYGCAEQVGTGTVPNQYGTWVLGRGGWCPGRHVDPWSADVSSAVDFAGENTIAYRGLFEGADYVPVPYNSGSGFGGRADVASWLVYYE